ncbi:glycosyl hydrolase family 28-related protein [Achromobacter xylosoxidans]
MTISSTTRKAGPFFGNDATTSFPFPFKVFKKQDVKVTLTTDTGADIELTLDSDYLIVLNADQDASPGGVVTYPRSGGPMATGYRLTLTGGLANVQPTDIQNSGGFYPQVVEDMSDRSTIQIQQLQEIADRSLKFSVSDSGAGATLPPAELRADKVLGFDSTGKPTVLVPTSGSAADVLIQLAGPSGSSMVGFIQAGVGAVVRTSQDKMRDEFNAKDFGVPMDGVTDAAPALNAAVQAINAIGGGVLKIPPGTFIVDSGINLTGCSNITLRGSGWDTIIKCTASLNGSNNSSKNDVIYALNFTGTRPATGYAHKNLIVEDMTIDCSLQSASGVPAAATAGYSLAAVEFMNVDYSHVRRCRIYRAFGNGVAISTYDPRLNIDGISNALEYCVVENNFFDQCLQGVLPQYKSSVAPDGITGSVIQIGSGLGCSVRQNYCYRPGGPFLDVFNCDACMFVENVVESVGNTPVGASPLNATLMQQTIGTIHSDFGLRNCVISGNTFRHTGGIFLSGYMLPNFFNGNVPTPGPQGCIVTDNVIYNQPGSRGITTPVIGASGATYVNPHTQSVKVQIVGGSGLAVTYRRGTDGAFVSQALGPSQTIQLARGDAFTLAYTTVPNSWVWALAPNIFYPAIFISGGSVSGTLGKSAGNIIANNVVNTSGGPGISCVECDENQIHNNYIVNPGIVRPQPAVFLGTAVNQVGGGSSSNSLQSNFIKDNRTPPNMTYNFQDDSAGGTARCLDNAYLNNRLEQGSTPGTVSFVSLARQFLAQNFGPGLPGPFLTSPGIPATGAEQANPFPYDCMVYVAGGVVTSIAVGRAGSTFVTGVTAGGVRVPQGCVLKLTYTTTPTSINWFRA